MCASKSLFPLLQITKSITNRGEAGSTPGAPRPTAGSTAGPSGMQQPAVRPPAATRSTITRSTGTITAKSIGNRRRRAGHRAGRTTRPCATTTTETHTFTMIVTRTPPAPARGEDIPAWGHFISRDILVSLCRYDRSVDEFLRRNDRERDVDYYYEERAYSNSSARYRERR